MFELYECLFEHFYECENQSFFETLTSNDLIYVFLRIPTHMKKVDEQQGSYEEYNLAKTP